MGNFINFCRFFSGHSGYILPKSKMGMFIDLRYMTLLNSIYTCGDLKDVFIATSLFKNFGYSEQSAQSIRQHWSLVGLVSVYVPND